MSNIILLWIAAITLMVAGLAGLVLPFLPGALLLFGGLLLGAWIDDFAYVGAWTLTALGVMTALTYVIDVAGTAFGARRFGASRRAMLGAAIGTFFGFFMGLPGILIGPFVGAVAGELSVRWDVNAATRVGMGATIGLAVAAAAKLALGITMVGVFLLARFF